MKNDDYLWYQLIILILASIQAVDSLLSIYQTVAPWISQIVTSPDSTRIVAQIVAMI